MVTRQHLVGFVSCMLLIACAGAMPRHYTFDGQDFSKGNLLGDKEENDLPFSTCAPRPDNKNPCIVQMSDDFFDLLKKVDDLEKRLIACEEGKP